MGAEAEADIAFFFRADGGVDGGAECLCELDGAGADSAVAAMDEEVLAGFEGAALEDVGPNGGEGFGDRTCLDEIEVGWDGEALAFAGEYEFRIAAAGDERAYFIAGFP